MDSFPWRKCLLWIGVLLVIQIVVLYLLGQPLISTSGYIKIWEGVVQSSGNSQHLSDWYSFSHIIHGFIFYLLTWLLFPRMSLWKRLLIALGVEIGWELLENTPWVINKYREQALAQGYTGDSIINSVSDSLMMVGGFILARRLPVWSIILITIVLEIFVGWSIRDNLTLNILNFLHPFDFITRWQSG